MLDSLNWRTSHTSHRSLSFILLPQMSAARPTIFQGGSTLRINLCISEISVHKNGAKMSFLCQPWQYTDLLIGVQMIYGKLLHNSATCKDPKKCSFQSRYMEYNIYGSPNLGTSRY